MLKVFNVIVASTENIKMHVPSLMPKKRNMLYGFLAALSTEFS